MNLKKWVQKDLKKSDYTIYMDMNIVTLPKKGLKARPYSMDMDKDKEDHIVTLPKKGLKTRPYNMDMDKEDNIVTLPKKSLKTRPYNIGMEKMEKKDLKKLTKGQLIKLLLKQKKSKKVSNHEDLLDNGPFKDEVARESAKRIKRPKPTRKPPPPPIPQVEDRIINVNVPKTKELNKALKLHAKSYGIEIQDYLNPLDHFTETKAFIESRLESLLKDMKGFKFIETLKVTFVKMITTDSINKTAVWITKRNSSIVKLKPSLKLAI